MYPVVLRVANNLGIKSWCHDHRVVDISSTGLEDANLDVGILGQPSSNSETCSSTAHDDEVIVMLEKILDGAEGGIFVS